jgi:hypothetical protein
MTGARVLHSAHSAFGALPDTFPESLADVLKVEPEEETAVAAAPGSE